MMRFVKCPSLPTEHTVRIHISEQEAVALAKEYERLRSNASPAILGTMTYILGLTRGVLDQSLYEHPQEHELSESPTRLTDQVPIGDLVPGTHFSCRLMQVGTKHFTTLMGEVKFAHLSTVDALMDHTTKMTFAHDFKVTPHP